MLKSLKIIALLLSCSVLISGCEFFGISTGNLNGWTKLDIPSNGEFRPIGMLIDGNSLITFGYDEQEFDCGILGIRDCRDFKIFKSEDSGTTWQQLVNDELAKKHRIVKGDKLNPEYLELLSKKYGKTLKVGKEVYDFLAYNEFVRSGVYLNDKGTYYFYQDLTMYVSDDKGLNWEEIEIENNFVLPLLPSSVIDVVDGFLVVHNADTGEKHVFKRNGNKFQKYHLENFYLVYDDFWKKELHFEGTHPLAKRMTTNVNENKEVFGFQMLEKFYLDKNMYLSSEFFRLNKKEIICNMITISSVSDDIMGYSAMHSHDNGYEYFFRFPKDVDYGKGITGFRVVGKVDKYPLIQMDKYNFGSTLIGRYVGDRIYIGWDIDQQSAHFLVPPDIAITGRYKGFVSDLQTTPEYLFFYFQMGLFRRPNTG
ncbi:MAG: hypothetical protein AAF502_19030 [Bacteroidota bacterium]